MLAMFCQIYSSEMVTGAPMFGDLLGRKGVYT